MKIFKTIPLKYIYLTTAAIAVVLTVVLYKTYAMYNVNTNSGGGLNDQNVKTYNFDINSSQNFIVNANSIYSFNVLVKNTTGYSAHFEIYYASNDDLTDVIIAEVVEDKTITTTALNTSFDLDNNNSKTIPLVIVNNSNTNKNIKNIGYFIIRIKPLKQETLLILLIHGSNVEATITLVPLCWCSTLTATLVSVH